MANCKTRNPLFIRFLFQNPSPVHRPQSPAKSQVGFCRGQSTVVDGLTEQSLIHQVFYSHLALQTRNQHHAERSQSLIHQVTISLSEVPQRDGRGNVGRVFIPYSLGFQFSQLKHSCFLLRLCDSVAIPYSLGLLFSR